MLAEIKPFLDWLQIHPHWGGFFAGCVALVESLVLIGLLVPGTVMMTAIGTLIGAGILPFYSTTLWAIGGAIVGDVFSFWLGYHYHQHLKDFWPFRKYPNLLAKGEQFFLHHGCKGIFLGRFLGPIRPILPVIAGMMSMSPKRFLIADIASAIVWAPSYMLPGILLGAASQELPPEVATKLILCVVAALLVLWCLSWLLKRLYNKFMNLLDQGVAWLWKFTANHPRLKILKEFLLDPIDPHNHHQLALALSLIVAMIGFAVLAYSVVHQGWLIGFNESIYYLMRSLRTTLADQIFIGITLLSTPVYVCFWLTTLAWLGYRRYWHTALHWLGLGILALGSAEFFKHLFHNPRPPGLLVTPSGWSFPSGHSTFSTAFFGFFAVLLTRHFSQYWRWFAYGCTAIVVVLIMFSRLYLGAHWLTDVIGGGLLGFICIAMMTLSYRRHENQPLALGRIFVVGLLSIAISWGGLFHHNFNQSLRDYTPYWGSEIIDSDSWWSHTTDEALMYRINRFGKPIELFNLQWAGNLVTIKQGLSEKNWHVVPKASLLLMLNELAGKESDEQAFITSQFYEDRKPVLVMTKRAGDARALLVLRLWDAHFMLSNGQPLWLGTVTYHKAWRADFLKRRPTLNLPSPAHMLVNDLNKFVYQEILYPPIEGKPVLFIKSQ